MKILYWHFSTKRIEIVGKILGMRRHQHLQAAFDGEAGRDDIG